jgi:hypothetical protein
MAGSFSNTLEEMVLKWAFRGDSVTRPTSWYVGLATASIADTDGLADITEEDDANYARQSISFDTPSLNASGNQEIANDAQIDFPAYDSNADNAVTHAFVATTTDNTGKLLGYITLDDSKQPSAGEVLSFSAGDLKINQD